MLSDGGWQSNRQLIRCQGLIPITCLKRRITSRYINGPIVAVLKKMDVRVSLLVPGVIYTKCMDKSAIDHLNLPISLRMESYRKAEMGAQ
jgi:hypothetical protein